MWLTDKYNHSNVKSYDHYCLSQTLFSVRCIDNMPLLIRNIVSSSHASSVDSSLHLCMICCMQSKIFHLLKICIEWLTVILKAFRLKKALQLSQETAPKLKPREKSPQIWQIFFLLFSVIFWFLDFFATVAEFSL